MDIVRQELRSAIRALSRSPGFAGTAILTFALGIGANIGIFSVVYGILLRPLPYRDADRLALIDVRRDVAGAREPVRSYFPLTDLQTFRGQPSFESVAFYATDEGVVSNGALIESVDFATVSDAFFSTLRGEFVAGRPLAEEDDVSASIVISERLSRRLFAGSAAAVGRQVTLSSRRGDSTQRALWRRAPFTIVGVVEASFQFPASKTDVWTTAKFVRALNTRCCSFSAIARLRPGVTLAQAGADAATVATAATPGISPNARLQARAIGLREQLVGAVEPSLLILMAAVGLLLLVACANVANLLLARNTTRRREMAVRIAIGASRRRLISQSLAESGLLAAFGGSAGLVLAVAMVKALQRLSPPDVPRIDAVHVDLPILLFACAIAAVATLVTGLVPALQSDASIAAVTSGRGAAGIGRSRIRRSLLVVQLTVSVVLLVGAVLLGRSLVSLMRTDLGVVTDNVATATINLAINRELTSEQQIALTDRVVERIRALPGVRSVGVGTSLPPRESRILLTLRTNDGVGYQAAAVATTSGYFSALGVRVLEGRLFNDTDDGEHPPVMIMTADTARHFFGGGNVIGQTLSLPVVRDGAVQNRTMTLVGVVDNVKYAGLDRAADNALYRPFAQQPWPQLFLVARTEGDTTALRATLQRQIQDVDRAIAVSNVGTLDDAISDAAAQPRFRTLLLGVFAALAVALAVVGLYGVVSYSVSQRTSEIGVRMALGARVGDVVRMVVVEGMTAAIAGVALGVLGAYALSRTVTTLLYGIQPTDPLSYALAAACLTACALVASYIPARRATRIDPAVALRAE